MPHSILKNAISSLSDTSPSPARSREDRNKETAIYHAKLLQQRKDAEALILASTELLLELPSSPAADPARPCLQDITLVKDSLRTFQPSDYDSLIEERNINKQCGYVLCPRPNRQEDTKAKYRILSGKEGLNGLKFVERHTLERWCSDDCGKRALFIKVQLSEEPAWTRVSSSGGNIILLEDERNYQKQLEGYSALIEQLRSLNMGLEEDEIVARMKALAIERGDEKASGRSFGLAETDVRENTSSTRKASAPEPSARDSRLDGASDSIEGYTPKSSRKKTRKQESDSGEDEDLMPTI